MQATSYKTVMFQLDENERDAVNNTLDILRKVKNKFLTSDMPAHQKLTEELTKLLQDVVGSKEISE